MKQDKMRAVVCNRYGPPDVLQLVEVNRPVPREDEILVQIEASAVTASDIFIRSSDIPLRFRIPMRLMIGVFRPRKAIIGLVFSGRVASAGKRITRFSPVDEVYGMTGFNLGAYAEYTCVGETDSTTGCVSIKPRNISFEEATSAAYGGSLAIQYMDMGNVKAKQSILVYGASGTSGTVAVQYGKHLGAKVTAVCSGTHVDLVKSLGADYVIDYTTTDTLDENTRFDFILDSVGKIKTSRLKDGCKRALSGNGKYVSIDDVALKLSSERLELLTSLIEGGEIRPIVDRTYPLEEIVEAHRYVEKGHTGGGVAITIGHQSGNTK